MSDIEVFPVPAGINVPTRPFAWAELQQILGPGGDISVLGRAHAVVQQYLRFKRDVLATHRSLEDVVFGKVFGYPLEAVDGKLVRVVGLRYKA
jgi:hypothetical protein